MSERRTTEKKLSNEELEYLDGAFKGGRHDEHPDILNLYANIREMTRAVAAGVLHLPSCRATSIALTKLEEAAMWGCKAITQNRVAILEKIREQREEEDGGTDGDGAGEADS